MEYGFQNLAFRSVRKNEFAEIPAVDGSFFRIDHVHTERVGDFRYDLCRSQKFANRGVAIEDHDVRKEILEIAYGGGFTRCNATG
jgi:hypothetical protein